MGPSSERMDSSYAITMRPLLKKVINHILKKGIGSAFIRYYTLRNEDEFRKQKIALNNSLALKFYRADNMNSP